VVDKKLAKELSALRLLLPRHFTHLGFHVAVPHCVATYYDQCQFRAMCALAFFAFLRVDEITATSQPGNCPIQLNQLTKLSRDDISMMIL
jgi:hypothetical protein